MRGALLAAVLTILINSATLSFSELCWHHIRIPLFNKSAVALLWGCPGPNETCFLDFVEFGAGCHTLSTSLQNSGLRVLAIDKKYSRHHDLANSIGFLFLLQAVRLLHQGGLLWLAPSCASWVFLSRGSTGRSRCCFRPSSLYTLSKQQCFCLVQLARSFDILITLKVLVVGQGTRKFVMPIVWYPDWFTCVGLRAGSFSCYS